MYYSSPRSLDDRLSDAQQALRDGYNDDLSRAIAEARDLIKDIQYLIYKRTTPPKRKK